MRRAAPLLLGMAVLTACADLLGVRVQRAEFSLVPVFDDAAAAAAAADNADQLHVRIDRQDSTDSFTTLKDTVLAIDPVSGAAAGTFTVAMFQSPTDFIVLLEAIRSSDGAVLFSGVDTIAVSTTPPSGTPPTFEIPVSYAGPHGASLTVSPRDTAVAPGVTFPLVATVRDTTGAALAIPVTFALANPADSTTLTVTRLAGIVTTRTGVTGQVAIVAKSADGLTDTAHVFVGSTPAAVRVTPGFADLVVPGTVQLTGDVLDGGGNTLSGFAVTWASRGTAVATVSGTGLVTAVDTGRATIVATSGTFGDSMRVVVAPSGNVVASALAGGRAFRIRKVGDTVVVDIRADMQFAGGELLGSYNATLTWNPAVLQYVRTDAGNFGAPTLNEGSVGTGQLRFGNANPNGVGGTVTIATVRFVALGAGSGTMGLSFSEMSAAMTFTNLLNRITVAVGAVTVVP